MSTGDPLTVTQAARALGVSRQRIQQLIQAGTLRATRHPGWPWAVPQAEVDRYRRERRPGGRPAKATPST